MANKLAANFSLLIINKFRTQHKEGNWKIFDFKGTLNEGGALMIFFGWGVTLGCGAKLGGARLGSIPVPPPSHCSRPWLLPSVFDDKQPLRVAAASRVQITANRVRLLPKLCKDLVISLDVREFHVHNITQFHVFRHHHHLPVVALISLNIKLNLGWI